MMRSAHRRGYFLVHMVFMLVVMLLLALVLGRVMVDMLAIQRKAIQHSSAVATIDSLVKRLRTDVQQSSDARFADGVLTLTTQRNSTTTYRFSADSVECGPPVGPPMVWRSPRLSFDVRREVGQRAALLWLTVTERAVPPTPTSRPRTDRLSLELPAGAQEAHR